MREGIQDVVDLLDAVEGKKLRELTDRTPVVIMDRGVVTVFDVDPPKPMGTDFE